MSVIYRSVMEGLFCAKKTMVSVSVSTLSLLFVVVVLQVVKTTSTRPAYFDLLAESLSIGSREARLRAWHTTCFRGCQDNVARAVRFACAHDPYRENRWRRSINMTRIQQRRKEGKAWIRKPLTKTEQDHPAFLSRIRAASFLKRRKTRSTSSNSGRSNILNECCLTKACAMEEYGEYCPMHVRRRQGVRASVCGTDDDS